MVEVHLDLLRVDRDVFGDHGNQLPAQLRQIRRAAAPGGILMREDDLQTFLGDVRGARPGAAQVVDQRVYEGHGQVPNRRCSMPRLASWVKRIGRSSPRKRPTMSR